MSGPNPPGPESDEQEPGSEPSDELELDREPGELESGDEIGDGAADGAAENQTSETEAYGHAYSAPESEQFSSGPYVPADLALYDYDSYDASTDHEYEDATPRWPWVVGVAAIVAAIALVISVSLLFARTDTNKLATPGTAGPSTPPIQDEIATITPPPTSAPPPLPPPATVTVTSTVPPPEPPPTAEAPPPVSTAASPSATPTTTPAAVPPATTTTTPAGPRQVTYSVTGTKAPLDVITVTYIDASGQRRTQPNVYIPWSLTLTPISQSEIGSVEASSLLRLSKLNCSITTSDGTVLSANNNDQPQTSC